MKKATIIKDPEMGKGRPIWHHHHALKMKPIGITPFNNYFFLIIRGSAAQLKITGRSKKSNWILEWKIKISATSEVKGKVIFSTEELRAAFGLSKMTGIFGDWIIIQYGGESAEQGKYIRWKDYLNIPCAGTGHDGDPNISIDIDIPIKRAVKTLLKLSS